MQVAMETETDMVVKRLSVPIGLEELMESLTKEVLRRKPSDIYAFASEHFAQLLEIRDQGNIRGSVKKSNRNYLYSSRDNQDITIGENNPIKVKAATFGAMTKTTNKTTIRNKSPAPKSFISKRNVSVTKVVPRPQNNNNKTNKQDRNKLILEKRRVNKKCVVDVKKKLESEGQPTELESKRIGDVSKRLDIAKRRQSMTQKKNEEKVGEGKTRSQSTSKSKQGDVSKSTTERLRRKSDLFKGTKKGNDITNTEKADELKTQKLTTSEKISPRNKEGKGSSSKDSKNFMRIPSKIEMSDEVVTQMGGQNLEMNDTNSIVLDESKCEKQPPLKAGNLNSTKKTISADKVLNQVGSPSTTNQELGKESLNIDIDGSEQNTEEKFASVTVEVFNGVDIKEQESSNVGAIFYKSNLDKNLLQADYNENSLQSSAKELVEKESEQIECQDLVPITKDKRQSGDNVNKPQLYFNIPDAITAVVKIQSLVRGYIVRKAISKQKSNFSRVQEKFDENINNIPLQREKLDDKKLTVQEEVVMNRNNTFDNDLNELDNIEQQTDKREKAAIKIQSFVRGHLSRKKLNERKIEGMKDDEQISLYTEKKEEAKEEDSEANKCIHVENVNLEHFIDHIKAIVKMQALVRGYLLRKSIRIKKETINIATPDIENYVLGNNKPDVNLNLSTNAFELKRENSKETLNLINDQELKIELDKGDWKDLNSKEANAIIKIQAVVRGFLTRKFIASKKGMISGAENSADRNEILKQSKKMGIESAVTILQAFTRGYLVRKAVKKRSGEKCVTENVCFPVLLEHDLDVGSTKIASQQVEMLSVGNNNGAIINEVLIENDSSICPKIDKVTKDATANFIGQEHIHYDSSRYDRPLASVINEKSSEVVEDISGSKQNSEETELHDVEEAEQVQDGSKEKLVKFDTNEAFGDDIKPRANSIEKISNAPNYVNDAATKIQSAWRSHRVRGGVNSLTLENLQAPLECDELPHQRGISEDAKKAAVIIQALFRGYMARKRYENTEHRSLKMRGFEGSLPTLLEVEGEDNKYSTSSSDHEKIEEYSGVLSNLEGRQSSKSDTSVSERSRTISDEVLADLKQLEDMPVPTEEPRKKSKTYTRSLTFDDPSIQQGSNLLTKSSTFIIGDEFQKFDSIDSEYPSLRSVEIDEESICTESESKLIEEAKDISEITTSIKQDVQKLKETLENGVEVKKVFENKPDDENITEITKSISEQVKQLEKALNQDTDIKSDGDYIEDKTDGTSELTEFLTRPVSKDSVTSTDSFDTVIFNDIHTRGLLLNFESSSAGGQNDLAHLNAIREQGDILVNDVLHTAKNKLQERDIETQIFEQEPVCQLTTDKRQSTTSDELRQLWQDEAATTIQKNYRGYRVRRDLGKQQNTSVNAAENEKRADYEITRYLNQITEPVRRAFLADTGLVNASGNIQSKERLDSVAAKVSPDVVYIPLRDYSSEEKEEEIVKTSTEDIQNLEANNNDEVIRDEEIIKKKEQQSSLLNPNEISGENQRTELLPTSIDEIDKEVDDKISACISSIVEPLTKRFQPVDSTDEKEEVEVSVEESEPVYEYIPLRNYSDDENKENESLPFLNDDITTTMSILKEDLETNEEEELDANEVFEEIDGRIQNNLNKLIYEKLRDEPNISNEILHEHSAVQDVVREGSTDVGKGTSEVITKQVSIHPTGYGSKEISEYIDSIIEPSKKAPLSKREPQSISDQEESVSKQDYKSKESNEEEEKLLKDEKSVNILENAVKHEIIPKDEVASIMSGKEEEKMNANDEEENDSVTVLKYNKGKMQAIGPDVLDSSVLKSTQKDAHNIIKDVIQMQNTVSNLDTKLHSGTLTTLENIPNLEDTVVKENVELIGKLPKLSDEVKKESVLFADKTLENVELVRDESSSLSYPIKEENEVKEDVEAVKFIEDNKAVFPEDKFEVCKTMQEKIIEDMIDSLDQTSDALTEVSDTYEVLNNDNHVNESRHTIENIKAFESDTSHNNNSEIIQARTTPIKQSQSDTSNTSESEITLELTSSVLPKDKIQDSIEPDQLTAIDDNFNFELSNSASDSTDNVLDVIRVEIKDKLYSEESNTGYQKLTDVENVKENYNEVKTISLPVHSLPLGSDRKQYDLRDDNINEETIVHKQIENEDTTSDLQKENNTEIISKQTESEETENIEQKQIPKVSIIKENSDDNEGLERSIDKIENYNTELQVEREHSSTYLKAPGDVEADEGESNSFATLSYTGLSSPEHQSKQEMDLEEDQELQSKMKMIESEIEDVLGRISSVDLNKKDNNDDENVRHSQATEFVESKSLPTNLDVLSEDIIVKNDIDMLDEEFDKRSKEKLIDDEVIETDIKIGVSDVDADQMHAVANNNVLRDSEEDVKDVKSADCKVDGEIIKLNENIDRTERNIDESRSQVESLPKTSIPPNKIREVSNIIIKDTRDNGISTCRNSNHHGDVQVNTMFSAKIEDDSNGNFDQKNAARNEITDEHQTDDIDIKQADTEQSNKDTEYDIQTTDAIETGEQADSGPSTKAVENNTQTNDATVDVEQASNDVKYDTQRTDLPVNIKQAEDKNKDIEDGTQAIDVNENRKQLDTEQLNKDMEYDIQEGDANKNINQPDTEQTNNIKDDIQTTDIINEMKQTDAEQSNKDGEDRSQVTDTSETRKQVNVEDSNKDEQNIHATDATETQKQGDSKQSSEDIEFDIQTTDANKSGKQADTKHSNKDVEHDNQASDSTINIEQAYIEQSSKSVENNMQATDAIENRKPEDSEQSNKVVKYDLQAINLTEEIKQADAEQSNKDGNVDFQGTDTTENRKQVHVELSSKYVEDTHATDATETIKQGDSNQSTEVIPFGIQITDANKSENQADTEHSNKAIEYHIEANGASKDTEQADAKQSKETVEKNMQTTDATENRKPEESVQTNEDVIDGIHAIGITKEIKQADAEQSNIDGEGNKSKKQANTEHSNNDIEYHIQASDATKNIKQADTEESNKGIENNIQTTDVNENRKPVDGEQSNEAVKHALEAINVTEEIKQKDAVQSNKDEEDDTRVTDTTESGKEVDVDHSSKDEDCDTKASDVTENIKQAHVADSSKDVEDTHATDATETRKQEDSKQSSEVIEFDIKTTDANNSETQAGTEQSNKDIEYHIQASDATKSIEQVDTEESNKSIENHIHATDTNENRMPEDNEQSNGVIKHDLQAINVTEKIKQKDAVQSNKDEEDDTQVTDATESRKQVDFEHSSEQDKEWDTEATDVTENIKQADVDDSNKDVEDTHATNSTEIRKQGDSKQSSEVIEFDIQTTDANNSEIQAGTEHSNKDVECYIQASDATKNIEQADAEQSKETAEKNMQTIDATKNRKPEDSEQSSEDVKVDTKAIDVTKEIKQADAEQSNKDGEDDSQVTDTTESRKQVDIEHSSEQDKEWNTEATDVTENIKQADVDDSSKDVEDTHATNSTEIRKQGDSKQSSEIVEFAIQTTNVNKSENQADTEHSNKDVEYHVEARDVTKNIQQTDTEELNKDVENNMQPTDEIEYKKQEDSEQLNKVVGYGAQTTDVTRNLKQADTEYSNKDIEDTQATHTTENEKVENAEEPSKDGQYEIQPTVVNKAGERADVESSNQDVEYHTEPSDVGNNIQQVDTEKLNKDVQTGHTTDATEDKKQEDSQQSSKYAEYDTQADDANKTVKQTDTEHSSKDVEYNMAASGAIEDSKQVGIEQSSKDVRYDTQTTDVIENINQEDIEHLNKDVEGTQAADATHNIKQTDTEQLSNASEYDTITTSATEAIKQTNIEQSNEDADNDIQATDTAKNGKHEDNEQSNNGEECNTQTTDINKTIEQADTEVSNKDMEYNPEENVITEDTKQVGIEQSSKDVRYDTQTTDVIENIKQEDIEHLNKDVEGTQAADATDNIKQTDTEQLSNASEYDTITTSATEAIKQTNIEQSNEDAHNEIQATDTAKNGKHEDNEQSNNGEECNTQTTDINKTIEQADTEVSNKDMEYNPEENVVTEDTKQVGIEQSSKDVGDDTQTSNAVENIKQADPEYSSKHIEYDTQTTDVNKIRKQADTECSNKGVEYHVQASDIIHNIQQSDAKQSNEVAEDGTRAGDATNDIKRINVEQLNNGVEGDTQAIDATKNIKETDAEHSNKHVECDIQLTNAIENIKQIDPVQLNENVQDDIQAGTEQTQHQQSIADLNKVDKCREENYMVQEPPVLQTTSITGVEPKANEDFKDEKQSEQGTKQGSAILRKDEKLDVINKVSIINSALKHSTLLSTEKGIQDSESCPTNYTDIRITQDTPKLDVETDKHIDDRNDQVINAGDNINEDGQVAIHKKMEGSDHNLQSIKEENHELRETTSNNELVPLDGVSKNETNSQKMSLDEQQQNTEDTNKIFDTSYSSNLKEPDIHNTDSMHNNLKENLLFKQEEDEQESTMQQTDFQTTQNKINEEKTEEVVSKSGDLEQLADTKHASPFYLNQDSFNEDASSAAQEKKFSEALKINGYSTKQNDSVTTGERLLHSSEFHDSIPISVVTQTPPKTLLTQTNGVQCDIERERSIPASTVLVHSGELHDNILPLALQMNQDPAGIEIVTSPNKQQTSVVGLADAQASNKDVSARLRSLERARAQSESDGYLSSMDTEKRNNSTLVKKNMESEAATKIQASFRGYQVRKQLKNKLARDNMKRTARRRSLGRITETKSANKQPSDLEEQSATKIQAGIRGFLVRRRQKKNKAE